MMKKANVSPNTRQLVQMALFVALIILLGLTPIGMIPLGFIYISLLGIPVVIGTLLLGLPCGLGLGFCFGVVSALKAFGVLGTPSTLVATLMAASPALALIMTFVPRLLVPLTTAACFRALSPRVKTHRAVAIAAVTGSLTNTVFYLGLMLLFYCVSGIDSKSVLALIGGTGLIAGTAEAIVNAVISAPVLEVLWKIQPKN